MSPIIGMAGICFALWYSVAHSAPQFSGIIDYPSMVLLGITPPCVMLLSHSIRDLLVGIGILIKAMFGSQSRRQDEVINILTHASAAVRSQGLGALVQIREKVRYELLRDAISLIVNNFTAEEIRHNITAKINSKQQRQQLAANLFDNMGKVSPGIGMLGTILGLVGMMANLNDPGKIGGGMALAMITTLYGLILGTFLYSPFSEKISLEAEKALELDLMVLEGVMTLKGKKSSVHLKDIMKTYGSSSRAVGQERGPQGGGRQ